MERGKLVFCTKCGAGWSLFQSIKCPNCVEKNIVDRTFEDAEPDNEITVILADGFTARFFQAGLTDDEYISRTKQIQELELKA